MQQKKNAKETDFFSLTAGLIIASHSLTATAFVLTTTTRLDATYQMLRSTGIQEPVRDQGSRRAEKKKNIRSYEDMIL